MNDYVENNRLFRGGEEGDNEHWLRSLSHTKFASRDPIPAQKRRAKSIDNKGDKKYATSVTALRQHVVKRVNLGMGWGLKRVKRVRKRARRDRNAYFNAVVSGELDSLAARLTELIDGELLDCCCYWTEELIYSPA